VTSIPSRLIAALVGLIVGGVLLALAFHGTPPANVWALLAGADWGGPAVLVLAATAAFVGTKAMRWLLLLGAPADLDTRKLLGPILAGLALNALVPHSGEFVRALALQRRYGRAPAAVLSSIVTERVFDLFGVLLVGSTALLATRVAVEIATAMRLIAIVAALLAAAIVLAIALPGRVTRLVQVIASPLPGPLRGWIDRHLTAALAGFAPGWSVRTAVAALALSVLQWLAVAVAVYGCAAVIGLPVGLASSCLVVVGIVVAFLLPNAPGYSGSVQVAFLVALKPLGFGEAGALAASLVYQLLMVLPLIIAGLFCLRSSLARP